MNKLSKEKRDRLLLVCLGTAAILCALYLLVVTAQRTALAACAEQTDLAKDKLAKAERWLRMAPGIQSRLEACRQELASRQEQMAPLDKFKWFYNTLEGFLTRHQVKLIDITREPQVGEVGVLPKFPYQAAVFGVKLRARYHDFGKFLADFENEFPYMRVQNIEIEPEILSQASSFTETSEQERRASVSEALAINMRVVTLVKPGGAS